MNIIKVAIAEDNMLAKKTIVAKLKNHEDVHISAIASNGEDIVRQYAAAPTDVILMDIEMPIFNGIEATKKIKADFPECKVIMLTTFDDDDKIFNAILNGASGYLLKDESGENIYKAITDVLNGGAAMSPTIAFKTLEYVRYQQQPVDKSQSENNLSARELEILMELKNGLAYKAIADKLFISEGTIRKHIENIYRKLQVNNKMNAVNMAVKNRWI